MLEKVKVTGDNDYLLDALESKTIAENAKLFDPALDEALTTLQDDREDEPDELAVINAVFEQKEKLLTLLNKRVSQ